MTLHKLAIIQARMSSSRLPGKVMADIAGKPMLWHVIQRASHARLVDQVVVATTTDPSDDVLAHYCQKQRLPCYRGSLSDVLDRFYRAATYFHADVIIRLTADCPLLDPDLIDFTVKALMGETVPQDLTNLSFTAHDFSPASSAFDFAANRLPPPWNRTLPIGLDVEVCPMYALERAWKEADQLFQREHVMPYLYEGVVFSATNHSLKNEWHIQKGTTSRGFRVALLDHFPDYGSLRWTVDTPADLEFVRQVFAHFEGQDSLSWHKILALLESRPELASINADVLPKSAFDVDKRTGHA